MTRLLVVTWRHGVVCLFFCGLNLAGCNAQGTRFSGLPPLAQDEALIIVYRPSAFADSGTWPDIHVDGQKRGELKNGGYLMLRVPPGGHIVEMKGPPTRWDIRKGTLSCQPELKAGETAYLRLLTTIKGLRVTGKFGPVPRETALQELPALCESQ